MLSKEIPDAEIYLLNVSSSISQIIKSLLMENELIYEHIFAISYFVCVIIEYAWLNWFLAQPLEIWSLHAPSSTNKAYAWSYCFQWSMFYLMLELRYKFFI